MKSIVFTTSILLATLLTAVPQVMADDPAILRSAVVQILVDVDSYLKELERGKPILKRIGVEAEIRAWQATYAGKDTGTVIVTLEFANMAAFARSEAAFAKAAGDAEYDAWLQRISKLRKITDDSLFVELGSRAKGN